MHNGLLFTVQKVQSVAGYKEWVRPRETVSDCTFDTSRLIVGIRWAKNEQFNRELLTFPLPLLKNSQLCPVSAFFRVVSAFKHTNNDHLFVLPNGDSITYRRFQNRLKEVLKQAGVIDYYSYSSHSFRRGGTTFSFLCGVPTEVIKLMGNWRSQAFMAYLEFPLETRSAACELMKMRILAMERHNII